MPTQEKIDRVAELKDKLERSSIIISTGYSGMNANQMVDLRRRMREGGVEFVVIKNNLLNLAADAAEDYQPAYEGQHARHLAEGEPYPDRREHHLRQRQHQ